MSRLRPGFPGDEFRGLGPPVGIEAAGQRVDAFLSRAFPFWTRRAWQLACASGHVLVNGAPVRASRKLRAGDLLQRWHPEAAEPDVDDGVVLLEERDGILAVVKPGNLPMHESGFFWKKTLHALVATRFGDAWHAVHRLDRETSGIVLHAATPELRHDLSVAFEERAVEKTYLAIVRGEAAFEALEIEARVGPDRRLDYPRGIVCSDGQDAVTSIRVLERAEDATLLEVTPRTGRYNQIRIHLEHLGLPLYGEKLYRGENADDRIFRAYLRSGNTPPVQRLAGFPRHCLHASVVAFRHPTTREEWRLESPMPDDMRTLWERLTMPSSSILVGPPAPFAAGAYPSRSPEPARHI